MSCCEVLFGDSRWLVLAQKGGGHTTSPRNPMRARIIKWCLPEAQEPTLEGLYCLASHLLPMSPNKKAIQLSFPIKPRWALGEGRSSMSAICHLRKKLARLQLWWLQAGFLTTQYQNVKFWTKIINQSINNCLEEQDSDQQVQRGERCESDLWWGPPVYS